MKIAICLNPYCDYDGMLELDDEFCWCGSELGYKYDEVETAEKSPLTKAIEKARGGPAPITRVGHA